MKMTDAVDSSDGTSLPVSFISYGSPGLCEQRVAAASPKCCVLSHKDNVVAAAAAGAFYLVFSFKNEQDV